MTERIQKAFILSSLQEGLPTIMLSESGSEMTEVIEFHDHCLAVHPFQMHLRAWGLENKRLFPWRTTEDPYHILIAELMLRRTQARQVLPVYQQFIRQYPDVQMLAEAPAEEVAHLLFPLGLAWRVPAFQQVAWMIVTDHHEHIPPHYETLLTLPGVGDYVASALCCFAFGQPIPIIDTNTVRVAGRLFGVTTHAESRRRTPIRQLLHNLLDRENSQTYNYSLLDLAALVCVPAHPRCANCPLVQVCATGQRFTVEQN